MIIKGSPRCSVGFWAQHLTRADTNERVSLMDFHGLAASDVRGALLELQAIAEGTRAKNGFYVASLNPCDDERLTPQQWEWAVDCVARHQGLGGQLRVVVEHERQGRIYRRVAWSRIDVDTMKAIPADFDYARHKAAAREIEAFCGLAAGA